MEEISNRFDNLRVPVSANEREKGTTPYYGANGVQDYVADYIFDDELVLLAEDGGNFGSKEKPIAYRVSGKCWVNNHAHVLKPKAVIDVDYLCYSLMFYDVSGLVNGATRQKLTQSDMRKMEIPLRTMVEQKKIVCRLNKLTELISLRKQQLAKLDELVKARFVEMFLLHDYPTKTLDELSIGKGEYGAQSASTEYDSTRPRYIRITDVNEDGTLNDDKVSSENITDDEQYRLSYGDFMFARMGATVGKTYAFLSGNQIFAGYLIRYKLNLSLANPRYLFWYTKLDDYQKWVKLNQSGAAQPGINAKKYGSLKIPVPPIALQNQFAAFVERVDQQKQTVQQSLEKLELMKKALMQEYFG